MAPHSSTLAWKIPWMEEPGLPLHLTLPDLEPLFPDSPQARASGQGDPVAGPSVFLVTAQAWVCPPRLSFPALAPSRGLLAEKGIWCELGSHPRGRS